MKKRKIKKYTIAISIIDLLVVICFFTFYGPFTSFKYTLINTALVTKTHQYIAYTFYSEDTVNKVMAMNQYIPITESANLNDIVIDTKPKENYDNPYDEEILTRDEGNDDYKYIQVNVGKYKAHMVAIYDPSKVELLTSSKFNTGSGQETVLSMCNRLNALIGINGGMFVDYGYGSDIPMGYLIKDGKIIWSDSNESASLIGFTNDNKLLLVNATGEEALKMGMKDALQFGPFLIVNGESLKYSSSAGGYDRAQRVAIAQRKDGVVLFLVTEGVHSNGPTLLEVISTLEKYGAYNAANLDGGTSAQLVVNGKLVNNPVNIYGTKLPNGRKVVSGFGLIK